MQNLISWKHSFRRLNEEYETAKKKKQALDNLLNNGRISQSTHDLFNMEIAEAIREIEGQQKALLEKMNSKTMELKEQIKTLEILLANFEIQHATGEVAEEVYQREMDVLSMGLEASRGELDTLSEAADQLSSGCLIVEQEIGLQSGEAVEAVVEKLEEPGVELSKVDEAKPSDSQEETLEKTDESKSTDVPVESEEKQEA